MEPIEYLVDLVQAGYYPELLQISERLDEGYTLSFNTRNSRIFMRKGNLAIPVPERYEWFALSYYGLRKTAETTKTTIFVSYSHQDLQLAFKIWRMLTNAGVPCYLAELYPEPGVYLWEKIKRMIEDSEIILALYTQNARYSAYVNQELGYAHKAGKLIIPLVEKGVKPPGFLEGVEYIEMDPSDPVTILSFIAGTVKGFLEDKAKHSTIAGVFLLLIGALALAALKK
jgi:hypothetical protein